MPRQLGLEVLDSIQKVLFPLEDTESKRLLQSLVSGSNFDRDVLEFESSAIRDKTELNITYQYFGARLDNLHEAMMSPEPQGWFERWFERKSSARYVMMATLAGVVFAVFLGMAGVALAAFQVWISWQQWQHPVQMIDQTRLCDSAKQMPLVVRVPDGFSIRNGCSTRLSLDALSLPYFVPPVYAK